MEQKKEWRISSCGVAVVLMQRIPETDDAIQTYLDCIPFCRHYVYDGDAMFCELGHQLQMGERCSDKIPTTFNLEYTLKHIKAVELDLPEGPAILFINTRKRDTDEHSQRRRNSASTARIGQRNEA